MRDIPASRPATPPDLSAPSALSDASRAAHVPAATNPVRERLAATARRPLARLVEEPEPSAGLRVVAGLFTLSGASFVVALALLTSFLLTGRPEWGWLYRLRLHPWAIVVDVVFGAITATTHLWTAHLLRARSRTGGFLALWGLAVPQIVQATHGQFSVGGAVLTGVMLALLASVWRELE